MFCFLMEEHVVLRIDYDKKNRLYYVDEDEGEIDFGFESFRQVVDGLGAYVRMNSKRTYEVVFGKSVRVIEKYRDALVKLIEEHNHSVVG